MKDFLSKMLPAAISDTFPFRCRMCGRCCRHVRESVPLESRDAFRLANFLRNTEKGIRGMEDVLELYTEPVLLHESGYMMIVLKTAGKEDACVFLKGNRCTVHPAKPRACRTYPVSVVPDRNGPYEIRISAEQPHHFDGPQMSVKRWIKKFCTKEECDFWNMDTASALEIAALLENIPQEEKKRALFLFLRYKYLEFDLDRPFLAQFKENNQKLLEALRVMAREPEHR